MTAYSNVPMLVGRLKKAAIDAYMRSSCDSAFTDYEVHDDYYMVSTLVPQGQAAAPSDSQRITRPGDDGEGGGRTNGDSTMKYVHKFNEIRSAIDEVVGPWLDLPDPQRINTEKAKAFGVVGILAADINMQAGAPVGTGELHKALDRVNQKINDMSGATVMSFGLDFIDPLQGAVQGIQEGVAYWGASLAAEQKMFERARYIVLTAIEKSTKVFRGVADNEYQKLNIILQVVNEVVEAFDAFVEPTGLLKHGSTAVKLGLKGMKKVTEEDVKKGAPQNYESAMKAFRSAFKAIANRVELAEGKIQQTLVDNYEVMEVNHERVDMSMKTLSSSEIGKADKLKIDMNHIDDIVNRAMPKVSESLEDAAKRISGVFLSDCVRRDPRVGVGESGPSKQFDQLKVLLYKLLADLAWESRTGTKDFELAVHYIQTQDGQSKAALDSFNEQVSKGSGIRPWDKRPHNVKGGYSIS